MIAVQSYIDHFLNLWEKSSVDPPIFTTEYSKPEKRERENNYLRFQNKMKEMRSAKKLNKYRKDPSHAFFPIFKEFLETVFDFEKSELNIILSEDFKDVSKDFFHKARIFGPELKPEDIYQGMRNVWIMNGIQLIMDIPVQITNSVFAYSMIYPYSDNLLDQDELSDEEKDQFCKRFNGRLHGENGKPDGFIEEQLFKLIGYFEEEFPRSKYPGVYDSLYAIQNGQTNSLKMIHPENTPESDIKNICFEKGGASVLADGYLVAGKLTMQEERALFGYGVYLQLLDDIQDIKEDTEANTKTIFSFQDSHALGGLVNKTIHFGRMAMKEMRCFKRADESGMIPLMNKSIESMIIESAGMNPDAFTSNYLKKLERYSPLSFDFIRKIRTQSSSERFSVFRKYFEKDGLNIAEHS